jgi:hypothetical protein
MPAQMKRIGEHDAKTRTITRRRHRSSDGDTNYLLDASVPYLALFSRKMKQSRSNAINVHLCVDVSEARLSFGSIHAPLSRVFLSPYHAHGLVDRSSIVRSVAQPYV